MKTKIYIFPIFLSCILFVTMLTSIIIFTNNKNTTILGVWWWNNRLDVSYLNFAKDNGITEIYYYTSSFDEKTNEFIKQANKRDIKVFWLDGDYKWIENPNSLTVDLNKFFNYQNKFEYKFDGIHLDIEPHQHPDWDKQKNQLYYKFIELTYNLRITYPNLFIAYDIPIWMNDKIEFHNIKKPVYAHIIDNCDKVTLMSYRDTSEKIYESAKDEIEYAISVGKSLNLSVETGENIDESFITFFDEGKSYMYQEINKVRKLIPKNFGMSIHHIYSWYNLKP